MSRPLTLGDLKRATTPPVTVKALATVDEWDVTPGLHEWIEGEITKLQTESPPHGPDCRALPTPRCDCGMEPCECDGFDSRSCDCPWPATIARQIAAGRKILAAHPYTTSVVNPGYGQHSAKFGCKTCHDWDGVPEGRGNCATILALAEGYGLEAAGDGDVEVVHG